MSKANNPLTEFSLIDRFFRCDTADISPLVLGIGDDCALLEVPAGQQLALSIDTAVAGRHFPEEAPPADIAYRCVAAAASDLAAMGAKPIAATLALCLPEADEGWLQPFSDGLMQALQDFGLQLIGGDTTAGPLTISLQVHGFIPNDKSMLRSGAKAGDLIYVSGTLGDAAAALAGFSEALPITAAQSDYLYQRFYRPQARLALGQALIPYASSAIDISDGLLADLGHICRRSQLGAELHIDQLPLSEALRAVPDKDRQLSWALSGGDDYELCFTVPQQYRGQIAQLAVDLALPLTELGTMIVGDSVHCFDDRGQPFQTKAVGYQHFS